MRLNTPDILKKIITRKEAEVAECKKNISEKQMLDAAYKDRDTRDFIGIYDEIIRF
jgi:indole-3-glycerol phosphate synthase